MIQENPYMQFFLGLDHFTYKILFAPSLFVHIRKRLGDQEFDEMNEMIIQKALHTKYKLAKFLSYKLLWAFFG
jgi:IS5 family transposase